MDTTRTRVQRGTSSIHRGGPEPAADSVPSWELIGAGRYMPRRTRGSFPGRELG
jgi:hypothetical protein